MRQDTLVRSAVALIAALALAACSGQHASPTAPSGPVAEASVPAQGGAASQGPATLASTPAGSAANFEIRFMTGMIDHYQLAVRMAGLGVERAVHPELRSMCETIAMARANSLWQLQIWMEGWHGILYDPTLTPGDLKMRERLASLSGEAFEMALLEWMVRHDRTAVSEGRQCVNRASHVELRDSCAQMVESQSNQIGQMEAWRCQWYGQC